MRTKLMAVFAVMLGAMLGLMLPAQAQPRKVLLQVTTHSVTSALEQTITSGLAQGYIDEIIIDVPTGVNTADVSLVTVDTGVTLLSKTGVGADLTVRPRWNATTTDGTSFGSGTNACYSMLSVYGEPLKFAVTNAILTNQIWKCFIKYDDGK